MFIYSLQRRAGGVELWAVLPARGYAAPTYFIRVPDTDAIDICFPDEASASRAFARKVNEMTDADDRKPMPGMRSARARGHGFPLRPHAGWG